MDQADFAAVTVRLWAARGGASPLWRKGAIRCPARRSISCWTTARSTSPWRSIRPKRRRRSRRPSARDGAHLHPRGRHHRQHPLRRDPVQCRPPAGAMVVADFLMSPEAQAHKQDPRCGAMARCSTSMPGAGGSRPLRRAAARRRDAAAGRADAGAPRAPLLVDGRDRGGVAAPVQQLTWSCCGICPLSRSVCSSDRSSSGCLARCCRRSATCRCSAASSSRSSPGVVCSPRPAWPRRCRSR